MPTIKEAVRNIIDEVRMSIPGGREFLDKSKDLSVYDIDAPLPIIDKTITTESIKAMVVKTRKTKRPAIKK